MDKKLLSKLQKLLAMGNGTANAQEADTALAMAYELMAKNNLELADVQNASREDTLGPLDKSKVTPPPMKSWEQRLFNCIAHFFDCDNIYSHCVMHGYSQVTVYVIGRESNRVTVDIMYKWLRDKIQNDSYYYKATQRQGYCLGVVAGILAKAMSIKGNTQKTDAWGLVPIDEVKQWMKQNYPNLYTTKSVARAQDWSAYTQGKTDGKAVNLSKQMQTTALPCA